MESVQVDACACSWQESMTAKKRQRLESIPKSQAPWGMVRPVPILVEWSEMRNRFEEKHLPKFLNPTIHLVHVRDLLIAVCGALVLGLNWFQPVPSLL